MNTNKRLYIVAVAIFLMGLFPFAGNIAPAKAADSRTFPETGKTVSGRFLTYWNNHGGLAQQGYPISEELQEVSDTDGNTYTVQYFQRSVFEYHPEYAGTDSEVLLSLLGVFFYDAKHGGNAPDQHANTDNPRKFTETGKTIGGAFRKYWEAHGGLAQQGFPISDEFQEVNDTDGNTYTVQYFQRAVFEYHPEFAGTTNEVLLSLLGVFFYNSKHGSGGTAPTATPTSPTAPTATPTTIPNTFAATNWSNVVATTNNVVLFYDAVTGKGATAKVAADGSLTPLQKFPDPSKGYTAYSPNWSQIVAGPNNQLLFYMTTTGTAVVVTMSDDGVPTQTRSYGFQKGWSYIAADRETGKMIFFNAETEEQATAQFDNSGIITTLKDYPDPNPKPTDFRWSQYVPLGGGIWFFYVQGNGNGLTVKINNDGTFTTLKSYTTFARDWTHIAAGGPGSSTYKIVFYNQGGGSVATGGATNAGDFAQQQAYPGVSKSWTNVIGTANGVVLYYAASTGQVATDKVNDDGSEVALQRYQP